MGWRAWRTRTLMQLSCQANRCRPPDDGSGEEDQGLRDAQVAGVSDEYVAARVSVETEASRTGPSLGSGEWWFECYEATGTGVDV